MANAILGLPSFLFPLRCLTTTFFVVQSPSHAWLFVTPRTAAHQASLSLTMSRSFPKFMSIESVMPSFSGKSFLCPPSELGAFHLCWDPNHVYLGTSFSPTTTSASDSHVLVSPGCCNKWPSTGWSKWQAFISVSSGGWRSEIQVPAWSGILRRAFLAVSSRDGRRDR